MYLIIIINDCLAQMIVPSLKTNLGKDRVYFDCLAAQKEQTSQRRSSPGGVGHWH